MGVAPSSEDYASQEQDDLALFPGSVRLPKELEQYILSFVTFKDLGRACLTSRLWYQRSNDETLWRDLFTRRFGENVNQRLLNDKGWKGVYRQYAYGGGLTKPEVKVRRWEFFERLNSIIQHREPERRGLLLGLDCAGKTSMVYRMQVPEPNLIPGIGSIESLVYRGLKLHSWDLGRIRTRPLLKHFMYDLSAVVFVIDSADEEKFEEVKEEMHTILKMIEEEDPPLTKIAFLVLANKQDKPEAKRPEELVNIFDMHELFQGLCWRIFGVSALDLDAEHEEVQHVPLYVPFEWLWSVL